MELVVVEEQVQQEVMELVQQLRLAELDLLLLMLLLVDVRLVLEHQDQLVLQDILQVEDQEELIKILVILHHQWVVAVQELLLLQELEEMELLIQVVVVVAETQVHLHQELADQEDLV
tara:strand:+ start:184 stop:537 length:354 start_codon:yes stop_codon:yes gene_type:complete